jgi:UDP-N-acetylmuramate dehydrogenase
VIHGLEAQSMSEAYSLSADAPLAALNTFRVSARAAWLADVSGAEALGAVLDLPAARTGPVLVLGAGSNLLLTRDFPGLVLRPRFAAVTVVEDDGRTGLVRAEAGVNWDAFVDWTLTRGYRGLENLALIPGLVGAAPIQNIGAYGAEVADAIVAVEAWDRRSGGPCRLRSADCAFAYRDSVFKHEPDRWIVTAVEFRLDRAQPLRLDYAGVREELLALEVAEPTAGDVAAAIRRLRRRKLPDPAVIGNAGSFFKNPVVPVEIAERIAAAHDGVPVFAAGATQRKLSAAWLIERCGWRGRREGDAGMSAQHALVLVNHGHASGAELLALARRVARSVETHFGVSLEPEPRIVGDRW